mmetsp:Transcript_20191/g.29967  ORF Transcript_20191/g.29967 Transcript_20191/m.29967 type:complete len:395 (-) Transcript_20191:456-1640(-)
MMPIAKSILGSRHLSTCVWLTTNKSKTFNTLIVRCSSGLSSFGEPLSSGYSSLSSFGEPQFYDDEITSNRVWKPNDEEGTFTTGWSDPVHRQCNVSIPSLLEKIGKQELDGGRTRGRQLGVLREDPAEDMRLLTENYTVPSLATAVRDREETLQLCADLASKEQWDKIREILQPYSHENILKRRKIKKVNLSQSLNIPGLEMLRKALMRMPRRVVQAHQKRAGVVVALCNVDGVPSLMFEKRAPDLRAHPDEVCLPGGMVSSIEDTSIVTTCLREMQEEIEGLPQPISVLGVLRCNWGEVHHLVGVAVTPVVCFVGELGDINLKPNPDEVAEVFTIPLVNFLRRDDWISREGFAPIFVGGPHVIWGLTGYIMKRFVKDILLRYTFYKPDNHDDL